VPPRCRPATIRLEGGERIRVDVSRLVPTFCIPIAQGDPFVLNGVVRGWEIREWDEAFVPD
jgi:hypothetical protein